MRYSTIFAALAIVAGTATTAAAFDARTIRDMPVDRARSQLDASGFRFTGAYNDISNDWVLWFNRSTGECIGFTQKGRHTSRAKSFKIDRCREAGRDFHGHRHHNGRHHD